MANHDIFPPSNQPADQETMTIALLASLYTVPLAIFTIIASLFMIRWIKDKLLGACYEYGQGGLPPGPTGLPIVGYLPFVGNKPHITFDGLKKKYGGIFSVKFGLDTVIILADHDSVREAFSQEVFNDRPKNGVLVATKSPPSITEVNGITWQEHKRCILNTIKDLGSIETIIKEEVKYAMAVIDKTIAAGHSIDIQFLVTKIIGNLVLLKVTGDRFDYDNKQAMAIESAVDDIVGYLALTGVYEFFPKLGQLLINLGVPQTVKMQNAINTALDYGRRKISERLQDLVDGNIIKEQPEDFIDHWLAEARSGKRRELFAIDALHGNISALIGAGLETTRTSMVWCFLIMAAREDVQRQIQAEIDRRVGHGRWPTLEDRHVMPFTLAAIMEVLRFKSPVPLNVFRTPSSDTVVSGYKIPKGIRVIASLWGVNHDPLYWGDDAHVFNPFRHLVKIDPNANQTDDDQEWQIKKNPAFMPFSHGKRSCPGERMAGAELFLILTCILQRYDLVTEEKIDINDDNFAVTLQPIKRYRIKFQLRAPQS